jgi:lipid-A-disaccharide synthase-like uncharacterized protein
MTTIQDIVFPGGKFLGIEWHVWKVVGWAGNLTFFSRFLVQWYVTEKHKRVTIPVMFWWLSLAGSMLLFSYALFYQRDSVFIFAYAFTWIPYIRNLVIHNRHHQNTSPCANCCQLPPSGARYCPACGKQIV